LSPDRSLRHPLLSEQGVEHGFGHRDAQPLAVYRPRQVHGVAVVTAQQCFEQPAPEADAIVSDRGGVRIGVLTADCVPILIAVEAGRAVAAVHAGWRGLAGGVIGAAVAALSWRAPQSVCAVIGPHVGSCCYEVDAPVLDALAERFSDALPAASRATRVGHVLLDLGLLARDALRTAGLPDARIGSIPDACTACQPDRFHSFRRDGSAAGRLTHFIAAKVQG
jgi:YfiH family protein